MLEAQRLAIQRKSIEVQLRGESVRTPSPVTAVIAWLMMGAKWWPLDLVYVDYCDVRECDYRFCLANLERI
ncbi:hypothetical protein WN55_08292 [Dufourea novaeangliae]|uniref:Uncharacterized protein n=1 Tax=Dufourea novaeangliae TaxID=178035 RepID=A0A154P6P9_DUFNO|nr:hypothetical protein WN55_08292 [Dufourea novaeangliae]